MRAGDVLSAAVVYVGTAVMGIGVSGFATGNLALILVWIGVALMILRHHRALTQTVPSPVTALMSG